MCEKVTQNELSLSMLVKESLLEFIHELCDMQLSFDPNANNITEEEYN